MIRYLFPTLAATLLLSLPARAECTYPTFEFFPERGGAVVVETMVTGGSSCTHNFAEGPGYKFTSAAIQPRPEHGTLRRRERSDTFIALMPASRAKSLIL
jgi:hypothetical protein